MSSPLLPTAERSDADRPAKSDQSLIAIDGLRALAALTVVAEHARTLFFVPWALLGPAERSPVAALFFGSTRLGHVAVLVFFVLSGYLVGGPLIQRSLENTVSLPSYFAARVARIFTPLLPACGISLCVGMWVSGVSESPLRILASATALNDVVAPTTQFNPPLWSIPFEIWFYVLAGSLAAAVLRRNMVLALIGCLLAVLVFTQLPAIFVLFWALGALGYHYRRELGSPAGLVAGLALWAFGVAAFEVLKPRGPVNNRDVMLWAQALACAGIAVCLPTLASARCNAAVSFLKGAAAAAASFSYSLYLFHFPVLIALTLWVAPMDRVTPQTLALYLAILSLTVFAGWLFYLLFERQTPLVRAWLNGRFGKIAEHTMPRPAAS